MPISTDVFRMLSDTQSINRRSHDAVIRVYDDAGDVIETRTRANTVIAVDVVHVIGPRIFIHPRVLECWSVVDRVPIDVNRKNAQIGCERKHRPWNCNNLAATANNTCPSSAINAPRLRSTSAQG
jgi:hypothetical protein